jgi:hypothetical protein
MEPRALAAPDDAVVRRRGRFDNLPLPKPETNHYVSGPKYRVPKLAQSGRSKLGARLKNHPYNF